ncbi:MAG: hypothetical protein D8H92_10750 [Campylobacter sp.]|nr:MAG: hypothetical protein D8H92_10750 [Campylobacter sp.]
MAKISELKLASIINEELTWSIQEGVNLHENLSKTSQNLNNLTGSLQSAGKEIASEAQRLENISRSLPKINTLLKLAHTLIGILLGIVLASVGYSYIVTKLTYSNISLVNKTAETAEELEKLRTMSLRANSENMEYILRYQAFNSALLRLSPKDRDTIYQLYTSEYEKLKQE